MLYYKLLMFIFSFTCSWWSMTLWRSHSTNICATMRDHICKRTWCRLFNTAAAAIHSIHLYINISSIDGTWNDLENAVAAYSSCKSSIVKILMSSAWVSQQILNSTGENRRENENTGDTKSKFLKITGEKWKDVNIISSEICREVQSGMQH